MVAGVLAGAWHGPRRVECSYPALDFYDGKGVLETLARELGADKLRIRAAELPYLQPGRSAEVLIGGSPVGWLGEVHPLVRAIV